MLTRSVLAMAICFLLVLPACEQKKLQQVPLDQIKSDKSNDYNYIFRKLIDKQKNVERKQKKDDFLE